MWKWVLGTVVLITAIVFMTCKYQHASQEEQTKSQKPSVSLPIAGSQNIDSSQQTEKCPDGSPCWHKLLTWPEGITAWAVIFTLIAITRQTYHTRRAADAANQNIEAVMNTERGFLLVDWDDLSCLDEPSKPVENWRPCFLWNARNTGKSPAFLIEYVSKFIALKSMDDLPAIPVYPAPNSVRDEPITTDKKSFPVSVDLEIDLPFFEIEPAYRRGDIILYAYGYVKYHDIYKREHCTRFGLRYFAYPTPRHEYDRFRVDGPDKYNEYT